VLVGAAAAAAWLALEVSSTPPLQDGATIRESHDASPASASGPPRADTAAETRGAFEDAGLHDVAAKSAREAVDRPSSSSATESRSVTVTVLDEDSQQPVKGAVVKLHLVDRSGVTGADDELADSTTGDDGRVSVSIPSRENEQIFVSVERPKGEDGDFVIERLAPTKVGDTANQVIVLPSAKQLVMWVKLLTEEGGAPIETATVEVTDDWSSPVNDGSTAGGGASSPNVDGKAHARDHGRGLICVTWPSWETQWIRIAEPTRSPVMTMTVKGHETPERALVIRLAKGAALQIAALTIDGSRVTDVKYALEGVPGRNAVIAEFPHSFPWTWSGSLDARGMALREGLPAGVSLDVTLTLGSRKRRQSIPAGLTAGERRDLTFQFGGGTTLTGRMVDQDDMGVPGRAVWVIPVSTSPPQAKEPDRTGSRFLERFGRGAPDARFSQGLDKCVFQPEDEDAAIAVGDTDLEGHFRIEDVSPGVYWIGPSSKYLSNPSSRAICPAGFQLKVEKSLENPLTLRVWRGLFIRGKVEVTNGALPGSTGVEIAGSKTHLARVVESDGTFKLGPLTPGDYSIRAVAGYECSGSSPLVKVKAGDTDVVLRLTLSAEVSGRVIDGRTDRWTRAVVKLTSAEKGAGPARLSDAPRGAFQFSEIPAGTYSLTAEIAPGRSATMDNIRIAAGESRSDLVIVVK
jgi:hypothetical protein